MLYLRPDCTVEPLFNQWYAWPYLLSPVTGAMYVANAHLKLMQSFVATPQTHVMALKNPAMRGGPFIDHDASRAPEVRELMKRNARRTGHMVKLAEAVKELDRLLSEEASGLSLEALYPRVPDLLRGYVELVYDMNHHASARFIEPLLYQSPYHDTSSQSVMLSRIGHGQRPFVFSTPRLGREGDLHIELPFASDALDELYRARFSPRPLDALADVIGARGEGRAALAALCTTEAPREPTRYAGNATRIRYFGHACVLIESKDVSILVDPVIGTEGAEGVERFSYADMPPVIDYVLITHNHQDHCMFEPLLELRHRVKHLVIPRSTGGTLADPSLKRILTNAGFRRVIELDELETIPVDGGAITTMPFLGEHADLNIQSKLAYHVSLGGRSVLLVADSNNIEPRLYEHLLDVVGSVDVLFIGMECEGAPMSWLYGPLFTRPVARKVDQSRRFDGSNFEKAADIVRRFSPGQVYVYAMGQEPWLSHLMSIQYTESSPQIIESNKLIEYCRARGAIAERPYCRKEIVLEQYRRPSS
ncbi:MAG TPA: MBL fold metallo-hydrolase [Candidatus Nanopelagicales bacterium]|nr:MBL fold metallo-hydrolase [Candidatus Nanopelagicales bacterium]